MGRSCEGKVALILGASQGGTGTGTAIRLAAEGAKVALVARDEEKLRSVLVEVERVGGEGVLLPCNLAKPDGGRDALVARTEEALGPIDQMVYVAAGGPYAKFETITQDAWQKALELNVKAPVLLMQEVIASMRRRGSGGAIVNIGTKAALPFSGPPFGQIPPVQAGSMYGGTKAALHRISQSVAAETYADRISVNVVRPLAAIGTPALRAGGWMPEELFEPVETMVEAVLTLLTGDPARDTGLDVTSIELLHERRSPVYDFTGANLVEGWQPDDLPAFIEARTTMVPLGHEGQTNRSDPLTPARKE